MLKKGEHIEIFNSYIAFYNGDVPVSIKQIACRASKLNALTIMLKISH